jgi:predicted pyridoxine 5'-phosphate oxidase superfamily flavin-nucleotide-binding protein
VRGRFNDIAFTPAVQAEQLRRGSRSAYAQIASDHGSPGLTVAERTFISERDSFYLASVGETGWPYVQHRGGPVGFLKVLGPTQIGFADFRGNRQYISLGNVAGDDRVALILMDYEHRSRLKILGHMRATESADDLKALVVPGYKAPVERGLLIEISAFDWNCPQHITPRFTEAQVVAGVKPLHDRIAELEAEVARLKG